MFTCLPGTLIETDMKNCDSVLTAIFSAGGLVLSQVCKLTGLEPYTVQNWVKRGFVSSPLNKKYSRKQFCRIATISMLKDSIQIDNIAKLLSHINGQLDDENDDMVDDSVLYIYFNELISYGELALSKLDEHTKSVTQHFEEPVKGAKKRLESVLKIMVTAYVSAYLKKQADILISSLDRTNNYFNGSNLNKSEKQ